MDRYREIERITKEMVAIASVNGTTGEHDIGVYIEDYLRGIPYFAEHPEQVVARELVNDKLGRRNVFAILRGTKGTSQRTIILHGHTDTVGVEDFGILKKYAFNPDVLIDKLKTVPLTKEVYDDLVSGEYMFGRGACDMKSGDAVYMALAKELSTELDKIDGNIVLSFNPVEENMHTGVIEALDFFLELKEKENFDYIMAINNDYTCPLYEGDKHQYIYSGAVGKLLPCFYVLGKSTHVGQCLEGFDASRIAAELVREINLNTYFCDGYHEEYSLPPSVLRMIDLKDFYNVQTAQEAFVYFNYFVHNADIKVIAEKLTEAAQTALNNVRTQIEEESHNYYALANMLYKPIKYKPTVYSYDEVMKRASENYDGDLAQLVHNYTDELIAEQVDSRDIALKVVKLVSGYAKLEAPSVVLFFAPPYCPHNTLKEECEDEKVLIDSLETLIADFGQEEGLDFKMLRFFPSLSDSSYLKIDDPKDSVDFFFRNFAEQEKLYPIPVDKIRALNIPAVNFGSYGKDAHKWTERVNKPYTFGTLPKLVKKAIIKYLG